MANCPKKKNASPKLERKALSSKKPAPTAEAPVEKSENTPPEKKEIEDASTKEVTQESKPDRDEKENEVEHSKIEAHDAAAIEKIQEPEDKSPEETPTEAVPASSTTEAKPRRARRRTTSISLDADEPNIEESTSDKEGQPAKTENPSASPLHTLKDALKLISDESLSSGKNSLYAILAKQDFGKQIKDDEQVVVHLNHGVDQEEFNQHSADILQRLRTLTGNQQLKLSTEITEEKTKTKLFTPQEKFQHLAEQNPKIEKLKKDLDLDFI